MRSLMGFDGGDPKETTGESRRSDARCKVLFIVNAAWFFRSHRLPIAEGALAAGYEVHLLAGINDVAEQQALEESGVVVHHASVSRGGLNPLADLRFLWRAMQVIRAVRPDLVHNVTVKPVLYGTVAARILRVRAVVNAVSGMGYAFSDASRRMLARALTLAYRLVLHSARVWVVFQNDDDAASFVDAHLVRPTHVVLIRGSGVDLRAFAATPEDVTEPPLVVLAARMLRDKGVTEFIAASRILRERGSAVRMALAGPLDLSNPAALTQTELTGLLHDAPVQWLGTVTDMPALYSRAHIVCLPSYREGLPKSLLEACAAARPIVTTDVPGCRAVVTHGYNGLIVPVRDAVALADALQCLIEGTSLRARLGRASRERAEREFAVESVVAQTLDLYRRLLNRTSNAATPAAPRS